MSDLRANIERVVTEALRGSVFLGRFAATVVIDHGNQTVDLEPDNEAMRGLGLQYVPVLAGVASATAVVEPGTRCLFGFVDGDPTKPRVYAWEYAANSAVISLDGGQAAVARYGGSVKVLVGAATVISGTAGGIQDIPNPSPPPPTLPNPIPDSTQFSVVANFVAPVYGVIQQGNPKVLA